MYSEHVSNEKWKMVFEDTGLEDMTRATPTTPSRKVKTLFYGFTKLHSLPRF